ncbi:MAG: hypothetical protein AAGN66_21850 [Acidobacteriota bacterium]
MTFLVLSLEAIGLMLLVVAAYWAGEVRLHCERTGERVRCVAEEKRCLGLVAVQTRTFDDVRGAGSQPPAMARVDHWLSLELATDGASVNAGERGPWVRVLAGGEARTLEDVGRVRELLEGRSEGPLVLRRSSLLWALLAAAFGCVWLLVISLIMREFLGYHIPWWTRAFHDLLRRTRG